MYKGKHYGGKEHRLGRMREQYKKYPGRRWRARMERRYAKAGYSPALVRSKW